MSRPRETTKNNFIDKIIEEIEIVESIHNISMVNVKAELRKASVLVEQVLLENKKLKELAEYDEQEIKELMAEKLNRARERLLEDEE